jgi:hypothetical protein
MNRSLTGLALEQDPVVGFGVRLGRRGYRTPWEIYCERGSSDRPPPDEKQIEITQQFDSWLAHQKVNSGFALWVVGNFAEVTKLAAPS